MKRAAHLDVVHRQELRERNPDVFEKTEAYLGARGESADRVEFEAAYRTQSEIEDLRLTTDPRQKAAIEKADAAMAGKLPNHDQWVEEVRKAYNAN